MRRAILTGMMVLCYVSVAAGQNQLQNSGFENVDKENPKLPQNWTETHRNYAPLEFSDVHFSGKKSALFIGDGQKRLWRQKITNPLGHGFIIKAQVKAQDAVYSGPDDKVIIYAHVFYKGLGAGVATGLILEVPAGTYDWKQIVFDKVIDPKLTLDYIIFSVMGQFSQGRIYIDDIELIEDKTKAPDYMQRNKVQDLLDQLDRLGAVDESVAKAQGLLKKAIEALDKTPADLATAKKYWEKGAEAVSHQVWAKMFPEAMTDKKAEAQMVYHGLGQTKETSNRYLDFMEKLGVNGCYLSFGGWSHVTYLSDLIPPYKGWGDFDALTYFIEEAHRRGIRVFGYMAVFHGTAEPVIEKGNLYERHPDWFVDGRERGFRIFPDPAKPQVADFAVRAYTELATRYAMDGIGLDYIRYPDPPALNYDENNRQQIKARYGIDILEGEPFNDPERWAKIQEFRAEKVGMVVERVRGVVKSIRPKTAIIACLISDPERAYRGYGQNWAKSSQWLDYASPMNYTDVSLDEELIAKQRDICKKNKARFIPAIGGMPDVHGSWTISTWAKRVAIQRKVGCDGIIIYRIADIDPAVAAFFGNGPFYGKVDFPEPLK